MSQPGGSLFDQFLHYYFQNLSADAQASRNEEIGLFFTPDISIEVLWFIVILLYSAVKGF